MIIIGHLEDWNLAKNLKGAKLFSSTSNLIGTKGLK